jgi:putative flippase GtrA
VTDDTEKGSDPRRDHFLTTFFRNSVIRYLIAGGLSFLVDFGLLALLHEGLRWPTWIATAIAFVVSFAFTYSVQRFFAFEARAPHGPAIAKYAALVVFNLVATTAIVSAVDLSAMTWAGGKVIATVVTTIWNYFVYRYWVFAGSSPRSRTEGD